MFGMSATKHGMRQARKPLYDPLSYKYPKFQDQVATVSSHMKKDYKISKQSNLHHDATRR